MVFRSRSVMFYRPRSHQGFTLMELLLVILITGIMATIVGAVITRPMQGYVALTQRAALVDHAEMALRRMQRDIRRALPNSIRVNGNAIEMVNVVEGVAYRDGLTGILDELDVTAPDDSFNTIGTFSTQLPVVASTGIRLVIYNLPAGGEAGNNIYDAVAGSHVITPIDTAITIGSAADNGGIEHTITMAPFHQFKRQSSQNRLYVIDTPVTYICDPVTGTLTRYAGYPIQAAQPVTAASPLTDAGVSADPVSVNLTDCDIEYVPSASQRPEIVRMSLTVTNPDSGESVTLMHQVHVVNAS